jgi:flagellar motor switch protein FliN/FliY
MSMEEKTERAGVEPLTGALGPDHGTREESAEELFARLAEEAAQAGAGLDLGEAGEGLAEQAPAEPRPRPTVSPVQFAPLGPSTPAVPAANVQLLLDVSMQITVELGRAQLTVARLLELAPGSVIELDRLAGEPLDVVVNGKLIARGEVVVVDENFGVRITEVLPPRRHTEQGGS